MGHDMAEPHLTPDKFVLLTGATSGIGLSAATKLAPLGATLTLVGRDQTKLDQTVANLRTSSGNDRIFGLCADLSSVGETRALAQSYLAQHDKLHVLLNNAGAIFTKRSETAEGLERTIALNHLAYFELTRGLLDVMRASAPARIVNVASQLHENGKIHFGDLGLTDTYAPLRAYSQSKLANVMFTFELAERLKHEGVTANALHPGIVASHFGRSNPGLVGRVTAGVLWTMQNAFGVSVDKGSDTLVYLATAPDVAGETGKYWYKRKVTKVSKDAQDRSQWARLWSESEAIVEGVLA